jgi:predicted nucleic acid-binding protein
MTKRRRQRLTNFARGRSPSLYHSTVVAAERRAGAHSDKDRHILDEQILSPYIRRDRVINPSAVAWEARGTTLASLAKDEGLVLRDVRCSLLFDILIARSRRGIGATLVSGNVADLSRIAKVFPFDFVRPFPPPRGR